MQLLTGIICLVTLGQVKATILPHRNLTSLPENDFPKLNTAVPCGGEEFHLIKVLGKGSYGMVYRGVHQPTGALYAIKLQKYDSKKRKKVVNREIFFLNEVRNEANIVHKRCVSKQTYGSTIFAIIVMDYMAGGDLFSYAFESNRGQMPEGQIRYLLENLADGLEQLYNKNIIHHDLKPENILLTSTKNNAVLKLADLGEAFSLDHGAMLENKNGGTPLYMSPERLMGQPHGHTSELWSLGIILYMLVMHQTPFKSPENPRALPLEWAESLKHTFNLDALMATPHHVISLEMKELIRDLLQFNEVDRMSMETFFERAKFCKGESCFKRLNFISFQGRPCIFSWCS